MAQSPTLLRSINERRSGRLMRGALIAPALLMFAVGMQAAPASAVSPTNMSHSNQGHDPCSWGAQGNPNGSGAGSVQGAAMMSYYGASQPTNTRDLC
jgi:hypothetical protein